MDRRQCKNRNCRICENCRIMGHNDRDTPSGSTSRPFESTSRPSESTSRPSESISGPSESTSRPSGYAIHEQRSNTSTSDNVDDSGLPSFNRNRPDLPGSITLPLTRRRSYVTPSIEAIRHANRCAYCRMMGHDDGDTPSGSTSRPSGYAIHEQWSHNSTSDYFDDVFLAYLNRNRPDLPGSIALPPTRPPSNLLPSTSPISNTNGEDSNVSNGSGGVVPRGVHPRLAHMDGQTELARLQSMRHLLFPRTVGTRLSSTGPTVVQNATVLAFRSPFASRAFDLLRASMNLSLAYSSAIHGAPPLSEQRIAEIDSVVVTLEDVDQCSICWEEFRVGETVLKLPCSHMFHEHCIVPWLKMHNTCPKCRYSVGEKNATQQPGNPGPPQGQEDHASSAAI